MAVSVLLGTIVGLAHPVGAQPTRQPSSEPPTLPHRRPQPPTALPRPLPLMTYKWVGGHCFSGTCSTQVVIYRDRTFQLTDGTGFKRTGSLPRNTINRLTRQIKIADFAALQTHSFTGTCPIAYDGQEVIYTFYMGTQTTQIASCTVTVDPTHPLFQQANQIATQILALPRP